MNRKAAAGWLLASASVGCMAGVAVPAYWVAWSSTTHPAEPFVLLFAAVLLALSFVGVSAVGFTFHKVLLGMGVVILNLVLGVLVTILTWFSVPPSGVVGLWLLVSGLVWNWGHRQTRRTLLVTGGAVIVASLAVNFLLLFIPVGRDLIGCLVNLWLVVWLAALSRQHLTSKTRTRVA